METGSYGNLYIWEIREERETEIGVNQSRDFLQFRFLGDIVLRSSDNQLLEYIAIFLGYGPEQARVFLFVLIRRYLFQSLQVFGKLF